MVSPFRSQAQMVKNVMGDRAKFLKNASFRKRPELFSDINCVIQEVAKLNDGLKNYKDYHPIHEIASLDDILSHPAYDTLILSLCRTEQYQGSGDDQIPEEQRSILNKQAIIDFVMSKDKGTLIVFGKAEAMNQIWTDAVYKNSDEIINS